MKNDVGLITSSIHDMSILSMAESTSYMGIISLKR